MSKLSLWILLIGVFAGGAVGAFVGYAALDHAPQEFEDSKDLMLLMYMWGACISTPFTLVAIIVHFVQSRKSQVFHEKKPEG